MTRQELQDMEQLSEHCWANFEKKVLPEAERVLRFGVLTELDQTLVKALLHLVRAECMLRKARREPCDEDNRESVVQ